MTRFQPGLRRLFHTLYLAMREFSVSECKLRAGALTYYTLFSLVPLAALVFGLGRGFHIEQQLRRELIERLSNHETVVHKVFDFADSALKSANNSLVAGIGVLLLLWTVFRLLASIEGSFNSIWNIAGQRGFFRRIGGYVALLVIGPLALTVIISAGVIVNTRMLKILAEIPVIGKVGIPMVQLAMDCLPLLLSSILLTFVYLFVPHTRVRWTSAVLGGVVAGTLFQLFQSGYLFVQLALSNYNVIYGSFSALPLFMIYVQLSWLVVLFGTELCYVDQNYDKIIEKHTGKLSSEYTEKLQLFLLLDVVRAFERGLPPPGVEDFERETDLTVGQLQGLIAGMVGVGLIRECIAGEHTGFVPGMPTDQLTIGAALRRLRGGVPLQGEPLHLDYRRVAVSYESLVHAMMQNPENRLMREL